MLFHSEIHILPMKLEAWMRRNKHTYATAASALGLPRTYVWKYAHGTVPSWDNISIIKRQTKGQVAERDWSK